MRQNTTVKIIEKEVITKVSVAENEHTLTLNEVELAVLRAIVNMQIDEHGFKDEHSKQIINYIKENSMIECYRKVVDKLTEDEVTMISDDLAGVGYHVTPLPKG